MKTLSCLLLSSTIATGVYAASQATSPAVGSVVGKHIYGLARDAQNDPLLVEDNPLIYSQADYQIDLATENARYTVSLFDHTFGGAYISEWGSETVQVIDTRAMDFGKVSGVHSLAAAQKSAWNSVLFNEYSLVDAQDQTSFAQTYRPYFKNQSESVKPYHYGWLNEVILLGDGGDKRQAKSIKNFAAGRTFANSMLAMPDAKTFYFLDSHASGNLYAFTAEQANSFAKGELYVVDGESLKLESLGKSSALKMKFKLKKAEFDQFFASEDPTDASCGKSFTYIQTVYGSECLKIQKKNRKYVGQFEPIRTAAIRGVKPFIGPSSENMSLRYNAETNAIELVSEEKTIKTFLLSASSDLGSQFLISQIK